MNHSVEANSGWVGRPLKERDRAHAWFGVRGNDAMTCILSGL